MSEVKDLKKEEQEKQIQDKTLDKVSGGFIHNPAAPAPHFPNKFKPTPGPIKPEPM